jgi:hypothetical protein
MIAFRFNKVMGMWAVSVAADPLVWIGIGALAVGLLAAAFAR